MFQNNFQCYNIYGQFEKWYPGGAGTQNNHITGHTPPKSSARMTSSVNANDVTIKATTISDDGQERPFLRMENQGWVKSMWEADLTKKIRYIGISEFSIESVQKSVSSEVKDMEDSWGLIIQVPSYFIE